MTRAERLAEQEAKAKARRDKDEAVYRAKQSQRLAEDKRLRRKRQALVGQMADDAGLLALSDADLAEMFAALAPLLQVPHPVAVLASLLADGVCPALGSVEGRADAGRIVSSLRDDLKTPAQIGVPLRGTQKTGGSLHQGSADGASPF